MNRIEALAHLRSHDSGDDVESPAGFDCRKSIVEIQRLRQVCEAILKVPLSVHTDFQDSSKLASITCIENLLATPSIEFSNFGAMFTISNSVDPERELALVSAIQERGFIYMDIGLLREPYHGEIDWADSSWTWYSRFFDWL